MSYFLTSYNYWFLEYNVVFLIVKAKSDMADFTDMQIIAPLEAWKWPLLAKKVP